MRLKELNNPPPHIGFVYTDPDSHFKISAGSFEELVANVNRHRHMNSLPMNVNQSQMIQDQICDQIGPEYCEGFGLGDAVHVIAQPIARAIDRMAGTNIQGCGSCARRRANLNS